MEFGKIIKKVQDKTGREVIIQIVSENDLNMLLDFYNGLITENTYTYRDEDKPLTFDEEKEWLGHTMGNMSDGDQFYFVAKTDNKIIAGANIERGWMRERETGTFRFSVAQEYRDRGIGTAMVKVGIKMAQDELSLKSLISWIFADDAKALYLAKKMGFVEAGRLPESVRFKDGYTDQILVHIPLNKIYRPEYGIGEEETVPQEGMEADDIV